MLRSRYAWNNDTKKFEEKETDVNQYNFDYDKYYEEKRAKEKAENEKTLLIVRHEERLMNLFAISGFAIIALLILAVISLLIYLCQINLFMPKQ